ncbi:hypothetical protein VTN77DRAFT_4134 [Rasamsonia byssochlamydoides]|uniref:uncharacterized protein n=1 Tax=Rasamsonia byssochlamydoides TaxID=89139 RepID=UPI0037447174
MRASDFNRGDSELFWQFAAPGSQVLPALRSCNLGFDYGLERYWDMCGKQAIFYHPRLEVSPSRARLSAN